MLYRIFVFTLISLSLSCSLVQRRGEMSSRGDGIPEKNVPLESREESPRKRILILPFIDTSGLRSNEGTSQTQAAQTARAALISWLNTTDRFVIVSNEDFPKDLNQFLVNFQYDLEAISKIANGMGIAAVVEGKILEMRAKKTGTNIGVFAKVGAQVDGSIQLRAFSCKNGKEILNVTRQAQANSSTNRFGSTTPTNRELLEDPRITNEVSVKAFKTTIKQLAMSIDKLSWEGRIALVKGDQYYINAGRLSGLQIGDILKVTEDSEEVYDPETGAFIGHVPGRMKGTLELISYFGKDGAIAVVHSGAGVTENDRVELY